MIPGEGVNTGSVGRRGTIELPGSQPTDVITQLTPPFKETMHN